MARVQMEEIVDHLSSEMRKALTIAVRNELPDADFDERRLFREFKRAVGRKCMIWESVPNQYIQSD